MPVDGTTNSAMHKSITFPPQCMPPKLRLSADVASALPRGEETAFHFILVRGSAAAFVVHRLRLPLHGARGRWPKAGTTPPHRRRVVEEYTLAVHNDVPTIVDCTAEPCEDALLCSMALCHRMVW